MDDKFHDKIVPKGRDASGKLRYYRPNKKPKPEGTKAKRPCLSCSKLFESINIGNRVCSNCKINNEKYKW